MRRSALAGMLIPYLAVGAGLYGMGSAWAALALYHAGALALLAARRDEWSAATLVRGWSARSGVALSALCASAGPVLVLLWPLLRLPAGTLGETLAGLGLTGGARTAFVIYYSTVHPVLEELLWRGWMPGAVDGGGVGAVSESATPPGNDAALPRADDGSTARFPALADALFGGYHVVVLLLLVQPPWAIVTGAVLWATAWLWRRMARRTGGLAIPVVSHAFADLSIMVAMLVLAARNA